MDGCVFCGIACRATPALVVRETKTAIAFLPIEMEVLGHTLISPKARFADFLDISLMALADTSNLARELALGYRDKIGATGFNLLLASGADAEQSVFHFHFHLLPRFRADGLKTWPRLPQFNGDRDAIHRALII